jgi:hypothetical protein
MWKRFRFWRGVALLEPLLLSTEGVEGTFAGSLGG